MSLSFCFSLEELSKFRLSNLLDMRYSSLINFINMVVFCGKILTTDPVSLLITVEVRTYFLFFSINFLIFLSFDRGRQEFVPYSAMLRICSYFTKVYLKTLCSEITLDTGAQVLIYIYIYKMIYIYHSWYRCSGLDIYINIYINIYVDIYQYIMVIGPRHTPWTHPLLQTTVWRVFKENVCQLLKSLR